MRRELYAFMRSYRFHHDRSVHSVNELRFRGKDRHRPSWPYLAVLGFLLVVQGDSVVHQLGVVGFCWLLGVTAAYVGLRICMARRSWTAVGAAGITICRGIGRRGRTYPWQEI